ncbi:hypothetical protein PMW_191 [Pseudomonas phage phiPMW]|uniref:Uncharacterized protein n=1 Tax=Pseudomonas phage phiPMW TaxID=1815582 RepID=A0A1S5R1N8_9CAUD|nr:hypothetical protein FDG97_gp159 [Pseudomonas phage phiPMW]ANA49316.1 hypothetical protein PMW_191 [Pseudomonas phage phiPMW]
MAFRPLEVSDVIRIVDKTSDHWSRDALVVDVSPDNRLAMVKVFVNSDPFWIHQKGTILSDSVWTEEGARAPWWKDVNDEDTGQYPEYEACGDCECCMAHRHN